jgi:hypothetical protein
MRYRHILVGGAWRALNVIVVIVTCVDIRTVWEPELTAKPWRLMEQGRAPPPPVKRSSCRMRDCPGRQPIDLALLPGTSELY